MPPRSIRKGLRLPPLKIMDGGEYVKDIWRIVLANHRTPKTTWGDYHAMIGSLHVAEARVQELLAKYGAETLTNASDQLLDYSERFMRAEIAEMPDGVYYAQDCMEDDGVTTRPYWMRLRLTIRGDEAICDWTDSDEQAKGPINATFVVTAAACYSGFLHVVSDDIPINSGCYRPIRLVTRPGTSGQRQAPGAVGRRQHRDPPAHPERRHPGAGRGGAGAGRRRRRGVVLQLPVRWLPSRVWRLLHELSHRRERLGRHDRPRRQQRALRRTMATAATRRSRSWRRNTRSSSRSTGCAPTRRGPGRWRGGLASSRTFRVTAPEITVNALFDRTRTHGPGIFGGQAGASSGIFIQRPGDDRFRRFSETFGTVSDSKFTRVAVTEGDRIQLESAGGGGFGDPRERPRELVAEDVRQGFVSPEAAREVYGYDGRRREA